MSGLFTGLSAFPLTPLRDGSVDEGAFARIVERLAAAGVDSITALGSTGSYAYLSDEDRALVARLAVDHAGDTPVFVGVGAVSTAQVLQHVRAAERAGAEGLLLAPITYQPLGDDEVFDLFRAVSEYTELPVILYDNPGTTHFTFTLELYARIAELPGLASIKIPPLPAEALAAKERVQAIRAVIPAGVTIGISGDASAANGLLAGCDVWYSVIGGTLPSTALEMTRAALNGRETEARAASQELAPIWELNAECGGSLRVVAAVAEHLGLAPSDCLPPPLHGLNAAQRARVAEVADRLGVQ